MAPLIIATLIAQATPAAPSSLVNVWLPLFGFLITTAGLVFALVRWRPDRESQNYRDAMQMLTEQRAENARLLAKVETLEARLEAAQVSLSERDEETLRLYRRVEDLERKVGGRRADDPQ